MRPRICFRCLTFFGINIAFHSFPIFDCQLPPANSKFASRNPKFLPVFPARPSAIGAACAFTLATSARTTLSLTHARLVNRIRSGTSGHRRFGVKNFTPVDPNLHANLTKRRARFCQPVIDVGPERMQRKLPLKMPLAAGDFSAIQTSTDFHLDSLRAKPE